MRVTFLGTGTSQGIPVIACPCAVCQSHDPLDKRLRTSAMLSFDDRNIVIDTGPDFRYQMLREQVQRLDSVLITHAHKDHIAGLDDVRAFNYQQQESIPIYGQLDVLDALKREFYYAFQEIKYPGVPRLELHEIKAYQPFDLFGKEVIPFEVMHFKLPILGYRIDDFAYITDGKTISDQTMEVLKGTKTIVINALQQEAHVSHFTLAEAISFAQKVGAEQTYFTHVGHRMGLTAEVAHLLPEGIDFAYDQLHIEV